MPRLSLVARSFSQLSMIIEVPAMQKPVTARSTTHQYWSMKMPVRSAMMAISEIKLENARTWPTRMTSFGAIRQPATNPVAQDVPRRPRISFE